MSLKSTLNDAYHSAAIFVHLLMGVVVMVMCVLCMGGMICLLHFLCKPSWHTTEILAMPVVIIVILLLVGAL